MTIFGFYCVGVALPAFCYGMYLMYFAQADDYILIEHDRESEIEMEPIELTLLTKEELARREVEQVACTDKKREELVR